VKVSEAVCFGAVPFVAAALAGCGGAPNLPSFAAAPQVAPAAGQSAHGPSRMEKGLKQRDLLYVSNANGTVNVYRYWQRTLVGVLTDFKQPMGACADSAGDVYIADYQAQKIYKYHHGGTKPIAVLDDSPYKPWACSVAPANGNLAVANSPYGTYAKGGNIAIYAGGSGKPAILQGSGGHFIGCAYDDRGDLLVASEYRYSPFWYDQFYYLPKHGTKLLPMTLPGLGSYSSHFGVVAGLAWDGKYWVVGPVYDQLFLYSINIKARYVGKITLNGGYPYAGPIWIYRKNLESRGTQAVAGNGESNGVVSYWKYPAGGSAIGEITKDLDAPFGVAVSMGTP
jgi:hypothetical protein